MSEPNQVINQGESLHHFRPLLLVIFALYALYDANLQRFATDGQVKPFDVFKLRQSIQRTARGLSKDIDPQQIAWTVAQGTPSTMTTANLNRMVAEQAASMTTRHSDYAILGGRLLKKLIAKNTRPTFSEAMLAAYSVTHPKTGQPNPMISENLKTIVDEHREALDMNVAKTETKEFTYIAMRTLESTYLLTTPNGIVIETPEYLYMRVALGIDGDSNNLADALLTYRLLANHYYTHATPTLINCGTNRTNLSSCFLMTPLEDSVGGVYTAVRDFALLSKAAGGVGMQLHDIRATGSYIAGTGMASNGIVPLIQTLNSVTRHIHQGANNRPGALAIYLEPWHADIKRYVKLRKNTGSAEFRARDIFYGLWIPDLFMQRVRADLSWSLFSPDECPDLSTLTGGAFNQAYVQYEARGIARATLRAKELWNEIINTQIETGMPYMLYKDAVNAKSNQSHHGTIKSSNLCAEIVQYSSPTETAVCNLASVALKAFVTTSAVGLPTFDYRGLHDVVKVIIRNLDLVIDLNEHPTPETTASDTLHRAIAVGVQGLADAFILMGYPFDSREAKTLNILIFETVYHAALETSCELAKQKGTYPSWAGSPAHQGLFQFDLWGQAPSNLWNWQTLRTNIRLYGLRNSLVTAVMPTATTSQILSLNESVEPNLFTKRTASGDFQIVSPYLVKDLEKLGLWTENMRRLLIASRGSVQNIEIIPSNLRKIYKTVWEISPTTILDMSVDRAPFICQSQSLNLYVASPTRAAVENIHFHGWSRGLKTGMYYLRTRGPAAPLQFTVDPRPATISQTAPNHTDGQQTGHSRLDRSGDERLACSSCSS